MRTNPPTTIYVSDAGRDRRFRTEAIVLTRQELGEADRILTVYTPGYGKLRIIAKGARRPQSKLGPYLDYFGCVALQLSRGRDLDVVTSAEMVDPHEQLRADLDAFGHASYFAELVRHLTEDRQENRRVYELLKFSLRILCDEVDPWVVTRHFEIALLSAIGYQPEVMHCVNCHRPIEPVVNALSPSMGGLLCPDCRGVDPAAIPLSINAQKFLRQTMREGLAGVVRLQVAEDVRWEVERAIAGLLRFVAERDFTSLRVLSALNRPS